MKKSAFFTVLVIVLGLTVCSVAFAEEEYTGRFTDIDAYINNSEIPSVNFKDNTYIFLDSLGDYGFELKWDENKRTFDAKLTEYTHPEEYKEYGNVGDSITVRNTDIKAYLEGNPVQVYHTDKGIIASMDNFSLLGDIRWYPEERKLRLVTGVYVNYVNFYDTAINYYEEFPQVPAFEAVGAPKYTQKYGDSQFASVTYVYERKTLTQKMYEDYTSHLIQNGFVYKGNMNWDSNVWFEKGETALVIGLDSDNLYVKVYF